MPQSTMQKVSYFVHYGNCDIILLEPALVHTPDAHMARAVGVASEWPCRDYHTSPKGPLSQWVGTW